MSDFELKQLRTTITLNDELLATTIKFGVDAAYRQITRDLNTQLYGDRKPPRPLTRRERWSNRIRMYRNRIKDAWLVLTDKAEIGDGW